MRVPPLGVLMALLPVVSLALELWWMARGHTRYDELGLPLPATPLPIPLQPEDEGRTPSVAWSRTGDNAFRWWVDLGCSEGVTGLHGEVTLQRVRGGWALNVRWFPPWSALLTIAAVVAYGTAYGLTRMVVPLGVVMTLGLFAVYYEGAMRAAASLRYAFVTKGPTDDPE